MRSLTLFVWQEYSESLDQMKINLRSAVFTFLDSATRFVTLAYKKRDHPLFTSRHDLFSNRRPCSLNPNSISLPGSDAHAGIPDSR